MTYRRFLIVCEGVLIALLLLCLGLFLFKPVWINAEFVGDALYEGRDVTINSFRITQESLLGMQSFPKKASVVNVSDKAIKIKTDGITQRFTVNKVPLKNVDVSYDTNIYTYFKLEKAHVILKLEYADGKEEYVQDFNVDTQTPVTRKTTIPVSIGAGTKSYDLVVEPIELDHIDAKYNVPIRKGDTFDASNVTVDLVYTDGYKFRVDNFSTEFSGRITDDRTIKLNLGDVYGVCTLDLNIEQPTNVEVVYSGVTNNQHVVHEGIPMEASEFKVHVSYASEQNSIAVNDFSISPSILTEAGPLTLDLGQYGEYTYTPEFSKITDIKVNVNELSSGQSLKNIVFYYDDGESWQVSADNDYLEMITDVSAITSPADVKFKYHDIEYTGKYDTGVVAEPETEPVTEAASDEAEETKEDETTSETEKQEPVEGLSPEELVSMEQADDSRGNPTTTPEVADDGGIIISDIYPAG